MPAIARKIIYDEFGIDIPFKDIIIVGDTLYDIECAKSAGAVSVSVGTAGSSSPPEPVHEQPYFPDAQYVASSQVHPASGQDYDSQKQEPLCQRIRAPVNLIGKHPDNQYHYGGGNNMFDRGPDDSPQA